MSVLLIETNKDGKYEFTKDELQKFLDLVEHEAFERGVSFERARKPEKEKEYVYLNGFPTNLYDATCKSYCTDTDLGAHYATTSDQSNATCKSTCIGTDSMDIN